MRIWFNKTFSTIRAVLTQLREAHPPGEITLICTHNHPTASVFVTADECYLEPVSLTGDDYIDWCLDFCQRHRIDLFWPGKDAAIIGEQTERFKAIGTEVLSVASPETLALLNNKADFYTALPPHIAQTMGFEAVNTLEGFDRAVQTLSAQYKSLCVKPALSVFGLGFRILDTERDSITHLIRGMQYHIPLAELRQGLINTPHFDTLLVMENLSGLEWSVDCAGQHGKLLCAIQRQKSQHAGYGQTIDNHAEIQGMTERLTAHFKLNGLFNIQFKEGDNGVRLLEINPRPSGGFGMACLAGVNLAQLALQAIKGEAIDPPSIPYGLKVSEVHTPVILKDTVFSG